MAYITGTKKNGSSWTPQFVMSIDKAKCIGCARCFKSCAFGCLGPYEIEEEDDARMIMQVTNDGNCIGCRACTKACPKGCLTHAPMEA